MPVSIAIVRRPALVFGVVMLTVYPSLTRACLIVIVASTKSTSIHRKPSNSPRRIPVAITSRHNA
ncbi:MAG: hypothetical protein D4R44_01350 [Actinobacteria bacterium]|nr:MAG: hypothetical protein D4R44_01350 [Actinomycetota bacterium]